MRVTSLWRTMSFLFSSTKLMPFTPFRIRSACTRPDVCERRQVNLCHVSRDNHLGVHSHAGEEHFDLLGGGVLRFVQDDDGIVQCASAHKGEGGNLDDVQLHILLQLGGRYHVLQGVIEWLQIRVDLVLHVAGQETELFAGFYGRTAEDDFLDLFIL